MSSQMLPLRAEFKKHKNKSEASSKDGLPRRAEQKRGGAPGEWCGLVCLGMLPTHKGRGDEMKYESPTDDRSEAISPSKFEPRTKSAMPFPGDDLLRKAQPKNRNEEKSEEHVRVFVCSHVLPMQSGRVKDESISRGL